MTGSALVRGRFFHSRMRAAEGNASDSGVVENKDPSKDGIMTDTTASPTTTPNPANAYATYHGRRELSVAQPTGSLALVNTQWIDSSQTIWGVPGTWAPLPKGESGLKLTAQDSDNIVVDGMLVHGDAIVRGKDAETPSAIVFSESLTGFVIASEEGTYALRVWDANSEGIQEFGSISTFDYDPEWVVTGTFTELPDGTTVGFEHLKDDGKTRELPIPGEVRFSKDGIDYNLAAFKAGRALQLVFSDSTSGDSTYSVGRFLFIAPNADGTIALDFNRAILPPCAFSYAFNCPMPPKQNRFTVPIEAGEKQVLKKDGTLLHE
jgi:uncharacterized protein (DUF1684 family)